MITHSIPAKDEMQPQGWGPATILICLQERLLVTRCSARVDKHMLDAAKRWCRQKTWHCTAD